MKSVDLIASWMAEVNTDPDLQESIVDYAKGRGTLTMSKICQGRDARFRRMAADQDEIGWRRFMEGMISKEIAAVHEVRGRLTGDAGCQLTIGVRVQS